MPVSWKRLSDGFGIDVASQRFPLLIVTAIALLAKGGALLPGYSIDDYGPTVDGPSGLLADVLSKGRVGHWLFLQLGLALQVEPNAARILLVTFSIAAYAIFGLVVIRFWGVQGNGWLPLAAAAIVVTHPYTCEIFTFRIGLPLAGMVMALLSLLLLLVNRPRQHLLLGGVIFTAALSFYPIALHFGIMIVLVGTAISLCRYAHGQSPSTATPTPRLSDLLAHPNARLLQSIVCGSVLYGLAGVVFGSVIGVSGKYFEILPLEHTAVRLADASRHMVRTFVGPNVLIPPTIQIIFALVVGCLLIGLVRTGFRRPLPNSFAWVTLGIVSLLLGAALWSVGLFLFLKGYWPVPRNMAHQGILWAGCLLLAHLGLPGRWMTRALVTATTIILVSFVGVNQHILTEQQRLNTRDLLQANRIIARLETLPGFERVRRVAFVGGLAWYPMGLQRTQWGDMNISAFGAVWSQVHLLREASGYDLRWSTDPKEKDAAAAYCAEVGPWPAERSVVLRHDVAFVCMGDPKPR